MHIVVADVLEQGAEIDLLLVGAPQRGPARLADDGHDRHVVEQGVIQAVEQVDRAGARGGRAHADLARELGVSDRLEGGHLLVAGLDERRLVPGPAPGGQQPVDPVPGVREHPLDAPLPQAGQQHVADSIGHFIYSLFIADSPSAATKESKKSFSCGQDRKRV